MNTSDLKKLNDEFGIPDNVAFMMRSGGLPFIEITNTSANATISIYGGQVISFRPLEHDPVLWTSDHCYYEVGKAIRGGIPICWPWFGQHPQDPVKPAHGFARTSMWKVVSVELVDRGCTQIQLRLSDSEATRELWRHQFQLDVIITIGANLVVDLVTHNTDSKFFILTSALHSYFKVEDITNVTLHGLEGCSYIDLLSPPDLKIQKGPLTFEAETDRTYLDTTAACTFTDPGLKRQILIAKKGSRSTVVWNPWIAKAERMTDFGDEEYRNMICVETTNAHTDFITVHPQKQHRLQTRIGVNALLS